MGLEKIQPDMISKLLQNVLKSYAVFFNYTLVRCDVRKSNTPTKTTNYDFTYVSEKNNRWLFIRVQDFFTHQNLIILINKLTNKRNVNIDVKNYFISELNDKNVKQKLIFKSNTEDNLEIALKKIFGHLMKHADGTLKKVLLGEIWIDMPMDWGDYK